ncbi:hypothetical protein AAHE18_02G158200 [Arachis hypogaea]
MVREERVGKKWNWVLRKLAAKREGFGRRRLRRENADGEAIGTTCSSTDYCMAQMKQTKLNEIGELITTKVVESRNTPFLESQFGPKTQLHIFVKLYHGSSMYQKYLEIFQNS